VKAPRVGLLRRDLVAPSVRVAAVPGDLVEGAVARPRRAGTACVLPFGFGREPVALTREIPLDAIGSRLVTTSCVAPCIRQQVRLVGGELAFSPPKGGREREVPLPDWVSVALSEHLRAHPATQVTLPWRDPSGPAHTSELVFTNRDGWALTRAYYQHNAWTPALAAAHVERNRANGFHALRHHYASVLLQRGVSIRAVAEYLGHHDPGFTLRTYAHLMPEDEDRSRDAIDAAYAPADPVRTEQVLPEHHRR
jgi:hypothetical protein